MAAFVRFVFTIMIVGMGVNLAVVLIANAHSQRTRDLQYQKDAARFAAAVSDITRHIRRADIVVESQRVDARGNALESTLLLCQYRDVGTSQDHPLPVVRVVIPGDRLQAGGLHLAFDDAFTGPGGEYRMLAGADVVLFGLFCGAGEMPPDNPAAVDERFTFLPRSQVPELLRLDPELPQASPFELKLWEYLWSQLPEVPRGADLPWSAPAPGTPYLHATWLKPAEIVLRRSHIYTAYIGGDGITLNEDMPGSTDVFNKMLDAGARMHDQPGE